jgi:hypothetical protein
VGQAVVLCGLSPKAFVRENFMKIFQSLQQNGKGTERRGRHGSRQVETVGLSDPERLWIERMIGRRVATCEGGSLAT